MKAPIRNTLINLMKKPLNTSNGIFASFLKIISCLFTFFFKFPGGTTKSPFGPVQLKLGWIFQPTYGVGVTWNGMTLKRKNLVFAKAYIAKMTLKPCLSTWKSLSSTFRLVKQMVPLWVKVKQGRFSAIYDQIGKFLCCIFFSLFVNKEVYLRILSKYCFLVVQCA